MLAFYFYFPSDEQDLKQSKHVCWCGKSFPSNSKLQTHLTKHSDVRPFACTYPDCDKQFKSRQHLRDHELRVHERKSHSREPTEHVGNQIDYTGYAQLPQTLTCKECDKRLPSNDAFEKHIAIHAGYKPYVCTVCDMTYRVKSILLRHIRIDHMGLAQFVCKFCGKKFASKSHWEQHVRTHTGDKPYECKYCGRRFTHEHVCKSHEIKHTGVKPFACGLCDYKCYTQWELTGHHSRKHQGIHVNKESYYC